ncbi:type I-D CRISPR-associated helicase Cas3' [Synechococcales cyanobacterium C]|uniref:Type I-D CRISPR-associated helicase Cas3 n=1 Tax=Petrachloros mirabilis ULC683 TaxID=2781853 RepID=A0A8K1ZZ40_9CYAN|nr:type I-D CRISPR-associated helicase Cas3' [Petrachloros mirabilis]NCJ06623.1 type I-D CRISPR-associated helicase Cas3' [Petrachloros mirabilis ULC683]
MPSVALSPVHSCPAEEIPSDVCVPAGWQLSWHQVETLKALKAPHTDVVFNTAMTGDGKSLAAYLDVLQGNIFAIGLYPTNALASDQAIQIRDYIRRFQPPLPPRVNQLSGPELEVYAENEGLRKGSAIASRAGQSEVLITNPDIFHYLHRGAYLTSKDNPDKLWNRIDKDFGLFIFDEFHVFAAPQIASVLNTMLLIQATNRGKKFLFLSATPSDALLQRLDKAGFRCRVINPIEAGKYQFPGTQAESERLTAQGWRQVAHAIDLNFVPMEPTSKASETWLKENQGSILNPFLEHPGSKGAIILNSIAAVKRLTPIFKEMFAQHGLMVRENTGLSGGQEKAESLAADLVIGTSTIDVGVDFKINFLIFESSDAGNFIQRLGRLGRHDGYEKDGKPITFDSFRAYALVPNFFVERLFAGEEAVLADGEVCDRIHFQTLIREKYRQINDFEGYYQRWGAVQSFRLLFDLKHPHIQQQYAGSLQRFQDSCEQVFGTRLKKVAGRAMGWANDWRQLSGKKGNPIADDATSFRGSSPLQCGLYDLTEPEERDRFKTYDLPGILSNLEIEMWSKTAFLDTLKETATRTRQPIAKGRFEYCLGFMKLRGYREERLNWTFTYPGDLQPIADTYKVQVLRGLQVWQPNNPWVSSINQRLQQQAMVCYVLCKPVREVRLRLQLPMHFQLYPISDSYSVHDADSPYSVAFGQSALLIDTLAYRFRGDGGEIWVV